MTASPLLLTTKSSALTDVSGASSTRKLRRFGSSRPEWVGKQFGSLIVISPEIRRDKGYPCLLVQCALSGLEKWTSLYNLERGATTSLLRNGVRAFPYPALLKVCDAAQQRCTNPSNPNHHSYGARGIQFCFKTALDAAQQILDALGPPPEGMELDRRDNHGHYAIGNLRWATRLEQVQNRRNTQWVTYQGQRVLLQDFNSPYSAVTAARYARQGMTGEQIMDQAKLAIQQKRKGWQRMQDWFASMTSPTPALDSDTPPATS
jgi:hypothetical protein